MTQAETAVLLCGDEYTGSLAHCYQADIIPKKEVLIAVEKT
jgi:hypothetical protein